MDIKYTTDYHTISDTDLPRFNKELKKYTNEGWMPYGGIAVSTSVSVSSSSETRTVYCLLLGKTTKVVEVDNIRGGGSKDV